MCKYSYFEILSKRSETLIDLLFEIEEMYKDKYSKEFLSLKNYIKESIDNINSFWDVLYLEDQLKKSKKDMSSSEIKFVIENLEMIELHIYNFLTNIRKLIVSNEIDDEIIWRKNLRKTMRNNLLQKSE